MEREGPNCCLWVVGGTESLAKENDLYHAAKLGIPLVCLSVLKAAPLPSHHHHLGLEAHSFFGDHSRLRIRSLPPAAIPLSHSPWCTLGDLPKVLLHCPAQGPELQTKAWAPDFLHVACLPSCATDLCLDTSYSAACSSRLNDSQLPQGVGPLLTDLMLPNMPGHLLKRSLPFVTCFLLFTFKTLLILGRCFPCFHSLVISLHVPQSVPVLLSLGIFTSVGGNHVLPYVYLNAVTLIKLSATMSWEHRGDQHCVGSSYSLTLNGGVTLEEL